MTPYDDKWRYHFICNLESTTLDLTIFLKSEELTDINLQSSSLAYEMYNFVNFCNLVKKTGKKTAELYQKS